MKLYREVKASERLPEKSKDLPSCSIGVFTVGEDGFIWETGNVSYYSYKYESWVDAESNFMKEPLYWLEEIEITEDDLIDTFQLYSHKEIFGHGLMKQTDFIEAINKLFQINKK